MDSRSFKSNSEKRKIVLELQGISKRYKNGTVANDDVSFEVDEGEIHALVGENGAGKSTVMKMLYGLERPTEGKILLNGQLTNFNHPRQAIAAGIGLVPQHIKLVPSFTVTENLVLGREPSFGPFVDRRKAHIDVTDISSKFGLHVNPEAIVSTLSVGEQQRVEILKTLYCGAKILLLDEPTALLSPQESSKLFESIRSLAGSGITVILITHKMSEVRAVAKRFTVLRGGKVTGRAMTSDVSDHDIAEMVIGRALANTSVKRVAAKSVDPLVQARGLTVVTSASRANIRNVSFDVAAGEILGIAGVEGNGQDLLARVLSGIDNATAGFASISGRIFTSKGPRRARDMRVAIITEDRLYNGMAANLSIEENVVATTYNVSPFSFMGILNIRLICNRARGLIESFGIRAASSGVAMHSLSGGNMQKVILARELSSDPLFLVASQPTRGVDIGASVGLRDQLIALRDHGAAVILISADLDEIMALSDRISVIYGGELVGHWVAGEVDQQEIGLYMTGLKRQDNVNAKLDVNSPRAQAAALI